MKKFLVTLSFVFVLFLTSCSSEKFTVSFDTDGGTTIASQEVKKGELAQKPTTDPSKEGYIFDGWYENAEKTVEYKFNKEVTANITIYAKWRDFTYKVTFDTDGGSTIPDAYVKPGLSVSKPADPTKAGHTFKGWFQDEAFTTAFNFNTMKINADTTIYAKFEKETYVVMFDTAGGSYVADASVEYDGVIAEPTAPTKAGHDFAGWYVGEVEWDFDNPVKGNMTLVAKWTVSEYTVTFNTNGGSTIEDVKVTYNQTITAPDDPTKEDFIFVGWYKDSEFLIKWNFETKVTNNLVLYAKWEPVSIPVLIVSDIEVRIDKMDSIDYMANVTAYDGQDGDLTSSVTVDSSAVKAEVGTYDVIYSVTNSLGKTTTKTITVTVQDASILLPEFDYRDFRVKSQNLALAQDEIITGNFSKEELMVTVTNYQYTRMTNGNLQIEFLINNYLKPSTNYILSFKVKASKATYVMPYLQIYPVDYPYTNIMGNTVKNSVSEEYAVVTLSFTTPEYVEATYSLSMEFGESFTAGESGFIAFKDMRLDEAVSVTFETNGGEAMPNQTVVVGGKLAEVTPIRLGFNFVGWFKDVDLTIPFDYEEAIEGATTLYAKWEASSVPEISGYKDITVRLDKLAGLNLLDGVFAVDANDGDLTSSIVVTNTIEEAIGTYTVTYTVENSLGEKDTVTVNVYVTEATKSAPYIDNRDFNVKTQNLTLPQEDIVSVVFGYDEIVYTVTNFQCKNVNGGNLQIEIVLNGYLVAGKQYVFQFDMKSSKVHDFRPYLQKYPVQNPWTPYLPTQMVKSSTEYQTYRFYFIAPTPIDESLSLSIEFGTAFENGESGVLQFRDFIIDEAYKIDFDTQGGSPMNSILNLKNDVIETPIANPTRLGYEFLGWYKDSDGTEAWDFENDVVSDNMVLYAKWEALEEAVILGTKDLIVRLDQLETFDFLAGIMAFDAVDGDVTTNITFTDTIIEELGTYTVTYQVTNSRGNTAEVTVNVQVTEALKEYPALDNREFTVKTQNLTRSDIVSATFTYDEIMYLVNNFDAKTDNNGNLQIEYVLDGLLEDDTTYVFTFMVKASKDGLFQPYLQVIPVDFPWTNILNIDKQAVTTEYTMITIEFTTGKVNPSYSLSMEFGLLFAKGESGFIAFKDFQIIKK